ncbi:hypothetical protein [Comamonas sp. NoAH]|nr:hypothetical protein [Comamonas sp. NoAH]
MNIIMYALIALGFLTLVSAIVMAAYFCALAGGFVMRMLLGR